jgi:dihydrofolate synthase/folylpolyglutamate synthase
MPSGLDRLHALPQFSGEADDGFKPGVERMRALLQRMGNPQHAYRTIHIAGTNGKGSTASMAAAILTAHNHRTGLHTSPELIDVTERMRVNGTPAPSEWLSNAVTRYASALDELAPTFFEATTALSFLYFAEKEVEFAVVEVGLGGRLDATNVLHPDVCIITSIDLEHTNLLGDTLGEIAREKAGIVHGAPCVTAVTQDEALDAIREVVVEEQRATLYELDEEVTFSDAPPRRYEPLHALGERFQLRTPERDYGILECSLTGTHQKRNAALAVRALEIACVRLFPKSVRRALRDVKRFAGLRGRLDVLSQSPLVVADVAHNPSSLAATLNALTQHTNGPLHVGLALAKDKDARAIAQLLAEGSAGRTLTITPLALNHDRMRTPTSLASILKEEGIPVHPTRTVPELLQETANRLPDGETLLLTGSHHVVKEAIKSEDILDNA